MKTLAFALSLSSLLAIAPAFAADPSPAETPVSGNDRNHDESWYWGFSLGGGTVRYTDAAVRARADALKGVSGVDHLTGYVDLNFLWPLANRQTAIGVSTGGVIDTYSNDATDSSDSVTSMLVAFSAQHFFNSNIGDGLFVRGDVGVASVRERVELGNVSILSDNKAGWGTRAGVGYSFLLSDETRLPISFIWQHTGVSGRGSNAYVGTVGVLF